jgi:cytochrome c oxidase subunit 2
MTLLAHRFRSGLAALGVAAALAFAGSPAAAQNVEGMVEPDAAIANTIVNDSAPTADIDTAITELQGGGDADYVPLGPEWIKGQPVQGGVTFQPQYSDDGRYALWMHDAILLPIITAISLFVAFLLVWVVVRYNRRANATPSKTTHNTTIEIVWTVVPALILLVIAVPSIRLLAMQYEVPPAEAVTIKATGYQWYWTYSYPDNGEFEIISNMMPEDEAIAKGFPPQLEADNRMVVPAGVPIRLQTTAADVIHSFAVPSLWFKLDAIPGRINERLFTVEEPGIYYGQCSELCGARHAYMPIAVEALPMADWQRWVLAQGGTIGGDEANAEPIVPDDVADDGDAELAEDDATV